MASIYYQNLHVLRTKITHFLLSSHFCDYNIIVSSIFHSERFHTMDFVVYRCDRSPQNWPHSMGEDVLVAVPSGLHSDNITF